MFSIGDEVEFDSRNGLRQGVITAYSGKRFTVSTTAYSRGTGTEQYRVPESMLRHTKLKAVDKVKAGQAGAAHQDARTQHKADLKDVNSRRALLALQHGGFKLGDTVKYMSSQGHRTVRIVEIFTDGRVRITNPKADVKNWALFHNLPLGRLQHVADTVTVWADRLRLP